MNKRPEDTGLPTMPSLLRVEHARPIQLPSISAEDGSSLSFGEVNVHIPFEIKRFYYIYDFCKTGITRGGHAHKSLEQVLFCLTGKFLLRLDDGETKQDVELLEPKNGIFVGPSLWHDMVEISPGTVIMAVASDLFDESDYIRDYQQFLRYIKV